MSSAEKLLPELETLHQRIPRTHCLRKTDCCALLPQMTLVEALNILKTVEAHPGKEKAEWYSRIVAYFLLNAAKITGCPFLADSACVIYEQRPFGCRAYGLWSFGEYSRQSKRAVENRKQVQKAWRNLGVELPRAVTMHHPPYCRDVRLADGGAIPDTALKDIGQALQELDARLGGPAAEFSRRYMNDLGFLITAEIFGHQESLRHKMLVVKDILQKGRSLNLDYLLEKVRTAEEAV